jgi:very-short-patch-repair endonuclease
MTTKAFNRPDQKTRRRALRKVMPFAEVLIWNRIRDRQLLGCKFRRQFSVGPYILDFYCPELKLVIEIDGDTHAGEEAEKRDLERQRFIESFGIHFFRFTNPEVLQSLDGVMEQIATVIQERRLG